METGFEFSFTQFQKLTFFLYATSEVSILALKIPIFSGNVLLSHSALFSHYILTVLSIISQTSPLWIPRLALQCRPLFLSRSITVTVGLNFKSGLDHLIISLLDLTVFYGPPWCNLVPSFSLLLPVSHAIHLTLKSCRTTHSTSCTCSMSFIHLTIHILT